MRSVHVALLIALLLCCVGVASADPVTSSGDPTIGIRVPGTGSNPWPGSFIFHLTTGAGGNANCVPGSTEGTVDCLPHFDAIGLITEFTFLFNPQVSSASLTLDNNPQEVMTRIIANENGSFTLTGGSVSPENFGGSFAIVMFGFTDGTTAIVTSNQPSTAPEPATAGLLLSGLGAVGFWRLRRSHSAA